MIFQVLCRRYYDEWAIWCLELGIAYSSLCLGKCELTIWFAYTCLLNRHLVLVFLIAKALEVRSAGLRWSPTDCFWRPCLEAKHWGMSHCDTCTCTNGRNLRKNKSHWPQEAEEICRSRSGPIETLTVDSSVVNLIWGNGFRELRISCTVAQMEREGGVSPRVSPLAQVNIYLYNQALATVASGSKESSYSFPRSWNTP